MKKGNLKISPKVYSLLLAISLLGVSNAPNFAQKIKPTLNQEKKLLELKERAVMKKPAKSIVGKNFMKNVIVVKFVEGTMVRQRDKRLIAESKKLSAAEQKALRKADVESSKVQSELTNLDSFVQQNNGEIERLFTESEESLEKAKTDGEKATNEQLADLNLYYHLFLPKETSAERAGSIIDELNALSIVEIAYAAPIPKDPQVDIPPFTQSFVANQGYLNPAPQGVDAYYAWSQPGGRGDNVRIIDVEQGWNLNHEDLRPVFYNSGLSMNNHAQHGTAVLGILAGAENSYGVTGIAPSARVGVSSSWFRGFVVYYSIARSIDNARANTGYGDIILLETQSMGPTDGANCSSDPDCGYIPSEYYQAEFDATRNATANGRIVVAAAGNGSMDLDHPRYGNRFNRYVRDSGAIIVGAGISFYRGPWSWSSAGSRVDVQGWGDSVMTTGYGGIRINGNDSRQWYTSSFSGTSSGSAIVAGTTTAIQGMTKQFGGAALSPMAMRTLLRSTGTPQYDDGRQIGPLPNIREADRQRRCGNLLPGQALYVYYDRYGTDAISSCNFQSYLRLNGDGNLVLYDSNSGTPLWMSNTFVENASHVVMGENGTLSLWAWYYDPWDEYMHYYPYWTFDTGSRGAYLRVEDNGGLSVRGYEHNQPYWIHYQP